MRAAVTGLDRVRIPEVYPQLSGERILTQELIAAPNIGDIVDARTSSAGLDKAALGDRLVELFMHQVFTVGTFHADPHPGNILVEPDGTIVLIDLGAVGRLGQAHRDAVLEMMAAASVGDAPALRQALSRITVVDRRIDGRELDVALEAFLVRHLRTGGGISTSAFEDLAVLIGRYGIRLPRWFGTLSRTLVTLEGTIKGLDPAFSLVDAAKRHAESMFGQVTGADVRATLQRELLAELPRLRRLPERIDEILGQAASGSLSAQVSVLADRRDERLVTRLIDRLVLAIIAAATTIASVILIGIDAGPALSSHVSMNEVLGYFGLFASGVLGFRIVAGIIRDGET
jgi:ubiquinone biosynthesis protein